MLILLPPSEGKRAPSPGRPFTLDALSRPELNAARRTLLDAHGAPLLGAPAGAAADVYSGVLFDALDFSTLSTRARALASDRVLIFTALLGVVTPDDPIPDHKLPAGAKLPELGGVNAFWKRELAATASTLADDPLIIDARSSGYATFARFPRAVGVRVLREQNGRRTVVSHMAKQGRGFLARALLEASTTPSSLTEAADVARDYFATHSFATATGVPLRYDVELSDGLDIIWR